MTCDLALDDLPDCDLEAVYRIVAARVTDAVQRGRVEIALRWGRILNLALRHREILARVEVTVQEVRRRMEADAAPADEVEASHSSYSSYPVFEPAPAGGSEPVESPIPDRRRAFREERRRR